MEKVRKPFQGVLNIVRFNWHFYVIAIIVILGCNFLTIILAKPYSTFIDMGSFLVAFLMLTSLFVSYYVYDLSGIYSLKWINKNNSATLIVNINAGFDETSSLLKDQFRNSKLIIFDFYNPEKHTEISIKRARKAYPPFPETEEINSSNIPLSDNVADKIFLIFAAHEIRNEIERTIFFKEIKRILKPNGEVYITEHLRDTPNFLAYNIGFFHFHSKNSWIKNFDEAQLKIKEEIKITPLITNFILVKNGNTL